MLQPSEIEKEIEHLQTSLDELRPPRPAESWLGALEVVDRIDRFGRYHYIGPGAERILGFPRAHYESEIGWVRFNHPEDVWRTAILWQKALAGSPCTSFEYRTNDVEGRWVWLQDSLRPLEIDSQGHAVLVEGRWRDITMRKRREAEFLLRQWESVLRHGGPAPGDEAAQRAVSGRVVPFHRGLPARRAR